MGLFDAIFRAPTRTIIPLALAMATAASGPLYAQDRTAAPSASASVRATGCWISQMKAQLMADGTFDAVQAALTGGPRSPEVIAWTSGGQMSSTGPLATVIGKVTGRNAASMALYIASAARRDM